MTHRHSMMAVAFALTGFSAAMISTSAGAQAFPAKPIRIIVGYPPGGGADLPARSLAAAIQPQLGQQVIVDNRPGGGGSLAANMVAKSAADGYTLLLTDAGPVVNAPALVKDLPYDPAKELVIASTLAKTYYMVVAGAALKAQTMKDMIAEAKAAPGKLSLGHSGIGSQHHLAWEYFKSRTGIDVQSVAYKGSSASMTDVVGGQVPMAIVGPGAAVNLIRAGKVRALGISAPARLPAFPDIPAMSEFAPGYTVLAWNGVWAPSALPKPVLARLNAEINRALGTQEMVRQLADQGLEPLPNGVDESAAFWRSELALWPDLIRRLGITGN